ncbi:ankyrin repeat domain-containing protein 52 [Colletotrichum plurivorum]|uniref:Ankyrin repeat domain-containing protein 52 n=1 Tax=Colletotrichum plurivorum TaxID=2175906 RepID=A0A8H6K1M0_9PEZI|nr:ankyrin repeat domain-containing protein 52 [Colletotrichum plurivorum]
MEPVGLTIGIAGLAGLFSACLDAVQNFDSYKTYGRDSRFLAARFDADKERFERWGQAVGIKDEKLSDTHHPALDDQKTRSLVHKLLSSIRDFDSSADGAVEQQPLLTDGKFPTNQLARPHHGAPTDSKWRKATWALRGKTKRTDQVQSFATLVQCLFELIPPDEAKGIRPGHEGRDYGPTHLQDSSVDESPWIAEIRAFVLEVKEERRGGLTFLCTPALSLTVPDETKRALRAWLGCPYPNDLYDDSIQKRLGGTCEWILTRSIIRDWLSPDVSAFTSQMLWINGPAGFGKTVLCAKLVEIFSSSLQTPVAHFFLSSKFEGRDDPFMAMRSWIAQVISQSQAALDVVHKRRQTQHEQGATRATIVKLFREVLQAVPFCTFVLDGLDECTWVEEARNNGVSVVRFLDQLQQAVADTTTRILVVSRNEPEIRQGLTQYPGFSEYTISPKDVRADNIAYSKSIVNNKLRNKDEPTRLSISQKMADRCNGQFQWLTMQKSLLRGGRNKKQLERDIDETPAGLDHLYDRNWEKIETLREEEKARTVSLLRWAAFSLRPLTVCEITEAVLVNDDCDDLPVDDMPDAIDDEYIESEILGLCGSLIEVRGTSLESAPGSRMIHLAHFSVKQYLLCKIPVQGAGLHVNESLRRSNEAIENMTLAKLCLRYLSFQRVWDCLPTKDNSRMGTSFRDYAAGSWYQHAIVDGAEDTALVEAMNALFDRSSQTWDAWRRWGRTPIYAASMNGHLEVVKVLLEKGADVSVANTNGWTPLHSASTSSNGHLDVVKILLEKGADVLVATNDGRTPLHSASSNGHLDVVKVLLASGADVSVAKKNGWTPLKAASSNGHLNVVKILLEKGADVLVATNDGWTPLHSASSDGHLEVVKVLLENGADVSVANTNGRTPLYSASSNGHLEVVKVLLESGADVSVADTDGWTPLNAASCNGHLEVVMVLLETGADVSVADTDGWTPLHLASSNGHLDVFKVLLEIGADVSVADTDGWTPLHSASSNGHLEVVKVLLEIGADVSVADTDGWTPLYSASSNGHLDVVKVLLESGADVSMADTDGWTPLYAASCNGQLNVVKILLEKGADVLVATNDGWTPLHSASSNGHLEVVKVLLEIGADVSVADTDGWTPLYSASSNGHLDVVKVLLESGADVSMADTDGWTPLYAASCNGQLNVVKILLEKGADVLVATNDGWTPLNSASDNGHLEIVKVLTARVNLDHKSPRHSRTALSYAAESGHESVLQLLPADNHVSPF